MKKWAFILPVLLLAGCSAGGIDKVSDVYEKVEIIEEMMTNDVTVHTVVGEVKGKVVAEDQRHKWVEVDLSYAVQHPNALVEASTGKLYQSELVGYDESSQTAFLQINSSIKLENDVENVTIPLADLTSEERLQLKEKYKMEGQPSDKISSFDKLIFTIQPDEVADFIWRFEQADDLKQFVSNDRLMDTLQEAATSDFHYQLTAIENVAAGKTMITVIGEIVVTGTDGTETKGNITYSVVPIDTDYKIVNIQLSE